jgi:plasmid stability protein
MRTTLNLPDALMREVKIRAASSDRRLTDVLTELIRKGLEGEAPERTEGVTSQADFPLVKAPRRSKPFQSNPGYLVAHEALSEWAEPVETLATLQAFACKRNWTMEDTLRRGADLLLQKYPDPQSKREEAWEPPTSDEVGWKGCTAKQLREAVFADGDPKLPTT